MERGWRGWGIWWGLLDLIWVQDRVENGKGDGLGQLIHGISRVGRGSLSGIA